MSCAHKGFPKAVNKAMAAIAAAIAKNGEFSKNCCQKVKKAIYMPCAEMHVTSLFSPHNRAWARMRMGFCVAKCEMRNRWGAVKVGCFP
jgi:hypothetical protein